MYKGCEDTIAAIITPAGTGGVGIVRVSGQDAFAVLDAVFVSRKGDKPSAWPGFSAHYGWVKALSGDVLDEALVTVMRAPRSYTCEDVVEISCHGGARGVRAVLERCLEQGARLARPGEFTQRAFLNGRIDLAQAEAVLDIVNARTAAALRAGEHQLKGELSAELYRLRDALTAVLAGIEAVLNFPEDDTEAGQNNALAADIGRVRAGIAALLATAGKGRALKEGVKAVICGKPNVGKSSLLNALLCAPRAIVTDVAGTTRDTLEGVVDINGVPFDLTDTAGILVPRDAIEEEAVRRSRIAIAGADIVLLTLDQSRALDDEDRALLAEVRHARMICVFNKADLPAAGNEFPAGDAVRVSAKTGQGIDELRQAMLKMALGGQGLDGRGIILNDIRHVEALRRAEKALSQAQKVVEARSSIEFAAEDIKLAVNELDVITGRHVDDDVLEQIFSKFCIGK